MQDFGFGNTNVIDKTPQPAIIVQESKQSYRKGTIVTALLYTRCWKEFEAMQLNKSKPEKDKAKERNKKKERGKRMEQRNKMKKKKTNQRGHSEGRKKRTKKKTKKSVID